MSSAFDPGRSTRPQPLMNSVSPDTSVLRIRKHWEPGVWPGVCRNSISMSPTFRVSPDSTLTRSESDSPVTFLTPSASSLCA